MLQDPISSKPNIGFAWQVLAAYDQLLMLVARSEINGIFEMVEQGCSSEG